MGLFLDLIHLSASATDGALEYIYKAHHDHGDDGIWKPHDSPLVRRMIELFTERGLMRLDAVRQQFLAWKSGAHHNPHATSVQPPGILPRWSESELSLVRLYLESLKPSVWTLDDHMLAIEYVVQTYLPPDALVAEADWLTTKAAMMGKVQANLQGAKVSPKQADAILSAMPSSFAAGVPLGPTAALVLKFAQARAAEHVRSIAEGVRHRMRTVVADHLEQQFLGGAPTGGSSLESKLADEFATLNRDWRRIAITEAGEAQLQAYVASLKPGTKIKRVERYDNACSFCKSIDGKVVTVVASDHPDKDPDTMVWPGKNNVGRSASPRRRVGNILVHREPEEMWTIPAGLVHPHCRGRWVPTIEDDPGDDAAFGDMLRAILSSG